MKLSKNKMPWDRKMSIPVANMAVRRKILSKLYIACGQLLYLLSYPNFIFPSTQLKLILFNKVHYMLTT
jgi:hypothetical protein